jgi:hypothetical protein
MTLPFSQSLRATQSRSNLSLRRCISHYVKDCFETLFLAMTFILPVIANEVTRSFTITSPFSQSLRATQSRSNLSLRRCISRYVKDCFETLFLAMTFMLTVIANEVMRSFTITSPFSQSLRATQSRSNLSLRRCISHYVYKFIYLTNLN